MKFSKKCIICIIFTLFFLIGCAELSVEEYARTGWTGLSIETLKEAISRPNYDDAYKAKIGWKETTYRLDNGNWVYVELIREARKDHYIHWEINPQGIIVGSRVEKSSNPP